jgi:hypothetical protein
VLSFACKQKPSDLNNERIEALTSTLDALISKPSNKVYKIMINYNLAAGCIITTGTNVCRFVQKFTFRNYTRKLCPNFGRDWKTPTFQRSK